MRVGEDKVELDETTYTFGQAWELEIETSDPASAEMRMYVIFHYLFVMIILIVQPIPVWLQLFVFVPRHLAHFTANQY
jgi:hypothetical protein